MNMKRAIFIISFVLLCVLANAQEHISFNGATFGKTQQEFQASINGHPTYSYLLDHPNKNLYHRYYYSNIPLNTYQCRMFLHCSTKSKIVFETVTWFRVSDLKEELKYFVQIFEEKYGAHVSEPQSELGYAGDISLSINAGNDGYYSYSHGYHKEMLALKYTVHRKSDNKAIGEIRISATPDGKSTDGSPSNYGWLEITYRDFAAAQTAVNDYNGVMNSIL